MSKLYAVQTILRIDMFQEMDTIRNRDVHDRTRVNIAFLSGACVLDKTEIITGTVVYVFGFTKKQFELFKELEGKLEEKQSETSKEGGE